MPHRPGDIAKQFPLIRHDALRPAEWITYLVRYALLACLHPRLWAVHMMAQYREGYWHPKGFAEALRVRLGRGADRVTWDPLDPKGLAAIVRDYRNSAKKSPKVP